MSNETLKYLKKKTSDLGIDHYSDYPKMNGCYISGSDFVSEVPLLYHGGSELPLEPAPIDYLLINNTTGIVGIVEAAYRPILNSETNPVIDLWPSNSAKHLESLQAYRNACKYVMHFGQLSEPEKDSPYKDTIPLFFKDIAASVALAGSTATTTNISNLLTSNPLENLITKSKRLLDLVFDWNEDGAIPIDREIYTCAISFLREYYGHLSKKSYTNIQLPEINPCPDGTIDLEWHTEKAQLLINFRRDKEGAIKAFYYGDQFSNKEPIKGSVAATGVKEHLAAWMKYLA